MHARRIICGLVTSECPLLLPGLSFHVHLCGKQTLTCTRFDSIHSGMVSAFGRKLWRGTRSTAVTFSEQNQCWISSLQTIQSGNLLHLVLTFKAVWNGAWVGARWGEWRSWTWRWDTLRRHRAAKNTSCNPQWQRRVLWASFVLRFLQHRVFQTRCSSFLAAGRRLRKYVTCWWRRTDIFPWTQRAKHRVSVGRTVYSSGGQKADLNTNVASYLLVKHASIQLKRSAWTY